MFKYFNGLYYLSTKVDRKGENMKFKIKNDNFKNWIAKHVNLSEHVQIVASENEIKFTTIDNNNTTIIQTTTLPDMFIEYECKKEVNIHVKNFQLTKILKNFDNNDEITVIYNNEDPSILIKTDDTIYTLKKLNGDYFTNGSFYFEKYYSRIPFITEFSIEQKTFTNKINSANNVSDIILSVESGTFLINSEKLRNEFGLAFRYNINDVNVSDCKSIFDNKRLKLLLKGIKKTKNIKLRLGINCPVAIEFDENDINVIYVLANKIED